MPIVRLRRVGGSIMLELPPSILAGAHICAETMVHLSVDEETGTVSIRPSQPHYTLDEMLARCECASR